MVLWGVIGEFGESEFDAITGWKTKLLWVELIEEIETAHTEIRYALSEWCLESWWKFFFLMVKRFFNKTFPLEQCYLVLTAKLQARYRDFPIYLVLLWRHNLLQCQYLPHQSVCYNFEPTLIHHYHPKSTVFILGSIHPMGGDKNIMECIHHYSIIEYFHCCKNPLCSICSPHPLPSPWQPLIFFTSA